MLRKRSSRGQLSPADFARALSLAKGDIILAAGILGVKPQRVRVALNDNPQLRAAFLVGDRVTAPDELEAELRKPSDFKLINKEKDELAELVRKQDFDLMRGGLAKAGIKEETLEKLKVLDGLAVNSGRFLVASLDLSHKMLMYSNISLMEQADYIKKTYLEDATLGMEYKIEWQKAYNEICDIIGKGYDRVLAGTQAMAKIMAGQGDEKQGGKKKPAFAPLKRADPVKPDAPAD